MLNQVILVGRLVDEPKFNDNMKEGGVLLAIPRAYKNEDGIYDTDFIPVTLPKTIAGTTMEYCKKGDIVGVKGHLEGNEDFYEIVGERVTFLSSKKD